MGRRTIPYIDFGNSIPIRRDGVGLACTPMFRRIGPERRAGCSTRGRRRVSLLGLDESDSPRGRSMGRLAIEIR